MTTQWMEARGEPRMPHWAGAIWTTPLAPR